MSDSGSESSPEESGTNTPSMTESGTVTPSTMGTGSKKFDFLLQQTELFSHFMGSNQKAKSPLKVKRAPSTSTKQKNAKMVIIATE